MLWCSGLPSFRKFLRPLSQATSSGLLALVPRCRPVVLSATLPSVSGHSFSLVDRLEMTVQVGWVLNINKWVGWVLNINKTIALVGDAWCNG